MNLRIELGTIERDIKALRQRVRQMGRKYGHPLLRLDSKLSDAEGAAWREQAALPDATESKEAGHVPDPD